MKFSIRTKLFIGMSCLIIFFMASSWLLNSRYLGRYYIYQKREALVESKNAIEQIYRGDPEAISLALEDIERNSSININILDPDLSVKYPMSRIPEEFRRRRGDSPLLHPLQAKLLELTKGDNFLDVVMDPRLKTYFLVLASRLNNDDTLILSSPIAAINESTAIANRFSLFMGMITIFLGGIAVYWLSNRFTKPILALNDIARRMSKLDFSKKYQVQADDEFGQLGSSINSLSDQLDKAISELTEANSKLREDIERERRIDKMRKEFVSNVSHELKTPIALIQGYAEGLKLNINENEEDKDFYCDVIMDETAKMNRLVRDLLDLSQIESGYFKLEKTEFDLSSLIDCILDKYRPRLKEKDIRLEIKKPEAILLYGDVVRLEQVLVNYLNNAIDHVDERKIIGITVEERNSKVRVTVYNSGKAIPDEALDKVWTSFYKVDKARTRDYGGTGLGLSVVRAIMELHQNAYGVENRIDGVVFWFEVDRTGHTTFKK